LPEGAAFCVERAFGGLDSLENTDRCRRAREPVPAVAAGLGNGQPGADEVAEDLRGEGRLTADPAPKAFARQIAARRT
jgi:hypothetical protein